MTSEEPAHKLSYASYYDTVRVLTSVLAPTIAKGVIKRRPGIEALAQHQGLDTSAMELLQSLRRKYGPGPLYLGFPFRPQVILLDPKDVVKVLEGTPEPYSPATKEKESSLAHFEPGHVLISGAKRRERIRPAHEKALATNERIHPFAERFKKVIDEEMGELVPKTGGGEGTELDWQTFSKSWFRVIRRIVLGDKARDDDKLTDDLDVIRKRGNWGFTLWTDKSKLQSYQKQVSKYLENPEEGSLVSRLPAHTNDEFEIESQVAHWLFAFEPAGMAVFRTLALLGSHPEHQQKAYEGAQDSNTDHPFSRAMVLESLRLWPTTPVILRELTQDTVLGGETLQKGVGIVIFAPFFHRDTETLSSPDSLHPETWLTTEARPEDGLVPFSSGPAICPAHNFVPMVTGLAVDAVVRRAQVRTVHPKLESGKLPGTLNHFEVVLGLKRRVEIVSGEDKPVVGMEL